MHVLNIHGINDVRLDPAERPVPGSNDVVLKIKACGICGTDLTFIKRGGIPQPGGKPMPLGHEAAGEIMHVGAAVEGLHVGQRVVLNPMRTPALVGSGGPEGAFTEELLVRGARLDDSLLPIPDDLPYDVAALTEPLAVALHGVNRSEARPGDKVVVFGCGPIGLAAVLWLVDRGVNEVVAVDISPERLERARALGAVGTVNPATENLRARLLALHGPARTLLRDAVGTNAYIDAACAPNIVSDVVSMARAHARLVVVAAYRDPVQLNLGAMLTTEMTITTAMGYPTEMPQVLAALPRLREKVASMISHRYCFNSVIEALGVAGTGASAKVLIEFDADASA
jgi:threonine dehydrogenase-like Zn-dependent dehydrogenase